MRSIRRDAYAKIITSGSHEGKLLQMAAPRLTEKKIDVHSAAPVEGIAQCPAPSHSASDIIARYSLLIATKSIQKALRYQHVAIYDSFLSPQCDHADLL